MTQKRSGNFFPSKVNDPAWIQLPKIKTQWFYNWDRIHWRCSFVPTWAWNRDSSLAVCRGRRTLMRNCLCSAFKGKAKPLMILKKNTQGDRAVVVVDGWAERQKKKRPEQHKTSPVLWGLKNRPFKVHKNVLKWEWSFGHMTHYFSLTFPGSPAVQRFRWSDGFQR